MNACAQRLLPPALLMFVAAAFLLPTGPAYAVVFYLAVLPLACLAAWEGAPQWRPGAIMAGLLIVWSGLTLLWGHDDGHRSTHFAVDAAMSLVFLFAMLGGLAMPATRRHLVTVLIWTGAANAVLSILLGLLIPQHTDRLHGWGATSHPILGASVMSVAFLAGLCRTLTERRAWAANLIASLTMAAFILATESRGPLLAVSVAALFLCAAGPWRRRALSTVAALVLIWRLLPQAVRQHHAAILAARGSSHRFEIWHRTLELIGQRPLFGHGLAANVDLPGITFPHDLYLSVLFYSGAVGFLLFLALAACVTLALWRGRTAGGADWLWMVALWMNTLLAGLTDLGQITKGPGPMWLIFWLPVGLVLAAGKSPQPAPSRSAAA